jgi:hypothetical protein
MWSPSNERFLDRDGCGDELCIDQFFKAAEVLAGLSGPELGNDLDSFDDASDDAATH